MAGKNMNGEQRKEPAEIHAIPKCDQWNSDVALNQTDQLLVTEQGQNTLSYAIRNCT